ncbi:hypothetical protein ACLB2K_003417 [Fragaria x ananassa]
MSLSFFIQFACLVSSLLVSVTLVHAQTRVFDVTNYGGRGDGITDNSKAFIDAWDGACQNIGGGMVLFPQGIFMVAPVVLLGPCKGSMELRIQGTLLASRKLSDFLGIDHWITIQYVNGLLISGGGTLDGVGADGWPYNDCLQHPGSCKRLPATLRLDYVTQGHIYTITSLNSKNIHINLFACKDVLVSNVNILAPGNSPNTDGIHIGSSQNIYIVHTNISTGDDCVSISSGSQYINVTGVQCGPGHGISIGSLGKDAGDTVNDLYVTHCRFVGTQNGVRIKTWADAKPGTVSRVSFEHLEIVNVGNPIIIDQEYCPGGGCSTQVSSKVQIRDVKFNDIRGSSATKEAVVLKCSQSVPCQDIELTDIDLKNGGPGGPAVSLSYNKRVFDVANYGARGDGRTDSSKAFIDAWNGACQNIGGGTVLFPKGTFMVAPVVLLGPCKGSMELRFQGNLLASKKPSDFLGIDHWITVQRVNGLMISGGGTLDGLGADGWGFNDCLKNPGRCKQLPATLRLDFVTQGHIDTITSLNSKNTHINLFACKDVLISNVKIIAPGDSPNTDGIHIGNSQNIYIVDTHISTGDDCVSVLPGSQYINVTGVYCGPGHGISIGSLGRTAGESVSDLYVKNCRFVDTQNGVRIKTWAVDAKPGTVSRVGFEHIEMDNVDNPIVIDQEYCPGGGCSKQESSKVQIRDVKFNDIRGSSATKEAVTLKCSQSVPCQDIELKDIDLKNGGPGGPAVSLSYNVRGRTYGIQNPPSSVKPPVASSTELEDYSSTELEDYNWY